MQVVSNNETFGFCGVRASIFCILNYDSSLETIDAVIFGHGASVFCDLEEWGKFDQEEGHFA